MTLTLSKLMMICCIKNTVALRETETAVDPGSEGRGRRLGVSPRIFFVYLGQFSGHLKTFVQKIEGGFACVTHRIRHWLSQ